MEPIEILLDRIDANPWQPRETEDKEHIKKIALSIAQDGLMQVPVGRWVFPDGTPVHGMGRADLTGSGLRVQLAFGHSRLAAFWWLIGRICRCWCARSRTRRCSGWLSGRTWRARI
jgi:hypothetical protein